MSSGKRVLIVDDEIAIRDAITIYLQQADIMVDTAENGIEALHLILSKPYDLIILDISMPYLNGLDLADTMKKEKRRIPILVITAREPAQQLWQEAGRLIKPFSLNDLQTAMDKIFRFQQNVV
jgi:two-component system response regulator PhoP